MSGYSEVTSALLNQVTRLVKPLSDTEMKRVASGESKVVLLSPGQQVVETTPALRAALRILEQLSADDLREIEQRRSRLALVSSGQQVVEKSPALTAALKILGGMAADDLREIEERRAKLVLLPKGAKIDYPLDPAEVAAQIVKLDEVSKIVDFLDADSRLGPPNLRKVAAALSIVIPPSIKAKADIQFHIAQSVAGRARSTIR